MAFWYLTRNDYRPTRQGSRKVARGWGRPRPEPNRRVVPMSGSDAAVRRLETDRGSGGRSGERTAAGESTQPAGALAGTTSSTVIPPARGLDEMT